MPLSKEQDEFNAHLCRSSFDYTMPRPELAWQAFKDFVQTPQSDCSTGQIGFECFHVWDLDNVLWLEFIWEPKKENDNFLRVECAFYREVPEEMRAVSKQFYWSPEQEQTQREKNIKWDLFTYLSCVEALPEFKMCMALDDWKWHQYD